VAAPIHARRRRPSGDGSVYRTDDGRWRGVVDLGFVDGKRKRKYVSGPTQSDALGKPASALAYQLEHGVELMVLTTGQAVQLAASAFGSLLQRGTGPLHSSS
jgi:hypothetical protein